MNLYILKTLRTNAFSNQQHADDVQALWATLDELDDKPKHPLFGVYTDYRGDYHDDCVFAVASLEERAHTFLLPIAANMSYRKFDVEGDDVTKTWEMIWALEDAGTLKRAYTVDFEKYDDAGVSIYIAVDA